MKKTTYFYACLVLSLTESLELKNISKILRLRKAAGLKNFSSNIKSLANTLKTRVLQWELLGSFPHRQCYQTVTQSGLHVFCLSQTTLSTTLQWADNKQKDRGGTQKGGSAAGWRKTSQGWPRQRKTPQASSLCLQWPYKATPDTRTSLWRSRLSPPEWSAPLPRSCARSPEPVRLPLKGERSRTGCRDKIITAIFHQMKKKPETRARIRGKKENTWTSDRRSYPCAERKTGVVFTQNNLQRKRSKRIPSSQAINEYFQSHVMTAQSEPYLRPICGTTKGSRRWSLLSLMHQMNLKCFCNDTRRAQKITPRSQSLNVWFAVLKTAPVMWKLVEV